MTRLRHLRARTEALAATVRSGMSRATLSMFDRAPYPLEHTLDFPGDPGLLGPDSVSWAVLADVAAFVGGIRALLIQAAHPEVVAGVEQHSRYREDPFGRLSRTSAYVTATTYGAMPEVEHAVDQVRRIHRHVRGVSSRGVPYDAADPGYSAWVHNVLTDSFLHANQVYGGHPLSTADADRFVAEQTRIGALLGADPLPESAYELRAWVTDHPEVAPSPAMHDVVAFLIDPPLTLGIKVGYSTLLEAAVAITPERLTKTLGVSSKPGGELAGRAAVATLRWALGYSPSWALALKRNGSRIPERVFRRMPQDQTAT